MNTKEILIERCKQIGLEITDNENVFQVSNPVTQKKVTVDIPKLTAKHESNGEKVIEEYIYYIHETLNADKSKISLNENIDKIFPVIRSTSFPKSNLVYIKHTAETNVFFAFDTGTGYHLINKQILEESNLSKENLLEISKENLSRKTFTTKKQAVAGNDFYFVNTNDGYDASRILLSEKLKEITANFEGNTIISTPHQDVLIIVDVKNPQGYDVIAHLCMDFFTRGDIPITSLSFDFNGEKLEPIFIMANKGNLK